MATPALLVLLVKVAETELPLASLAEADKTDVLPVRIDEVGGLTVTAATTAGETGVVIGRVRVTSLCGADSSTRPNWWVAFQELCMDIANLHSHVSECTFRHVAAACHITQ